MTAQQRRSANEARVIEEMLAEVERLADEMSGLNFDDLPQVLRWLERVPEAVYHVDVEATFPWDEAAGLFQEQGYKPRARIDTSIFEASSDEAARAIINFALNGLLGRDPHYKHIAPYTIGYIRRWFELYG